MESLNGRIPADASWQVAGFVSAICGVLLHLAIRPFDLDHMAGKFIMAYITSFIAVVLDLKLHGGLSIAASLGRTLLIASRFNTGLFGSMLIYRAFFHRLHRFPGPYMAKLSRWYALRQAVRTKQSHIILETIHEKYGDFVRMGPRELVIFTESAIKPIYGPNPECFRSAGYDTPSTNPAESSIMGTRDVEAHRRRKKAWERGLSFRALQNYEPRVQSKVDLLLRRLAIHDGEAVEITQLCKFYGFDVMGDLGYSHEFHLLESGQGHPAIDGISEQGVYIGILGQVAWFSTTLANFMTFLGKVGVPSSFDAFLNWCSRQLATRRELMAIEKASGSTKDPQDIISWLIKAEDEGDESAPPGEAAFQEDSRVLIVAGSDTTSAALANALHYLTKHHSIYRKLQSELENAFPSGDASCSYAKLKSVPYLEQIIMETLRLKPPVPSGLSRLTPPEGIQVDGVFIPGKTVVSVPTYAIQRDPRYWGPDAAEFVPERWMNPEVTTEKAPFIVFTRGPYTCPGRHLALMELSMAISRIAMRYDLAFVSAEEADKFDNGSMDTFLMSLPPLSITFTPR